MAHPQLAAVRERYGKHCGYCGVHERDCGGLLTIDHFVPAVAGGSDDFDNLVYCCYRCNLYKGDFVSPSNSEDPKRVLHPMRDSLDSHVKVDTRTGLLQGITITGEFHIAVLQLNREPLVQFRLRKLYRRLLTQERDIVRQNVRLLGADVTRLQALLDYLRGKLGPD